ncbi:MSCRAMM family adhesin SdrC [Saliphagus infecundisoli]|uniref:MSCRAMM family adhesin SdrC n=1 Tax=Saliphagus infecundisoli TaxID=1849069 RepID=A0ABD5QIH1_9EURY|nr:MSCRAMM family adhesin SdrC [Saliphagus infecundisoli]
MDRRAFVSTVGAGTGLVLAGCLSDGDSDPGGSDERDGDSTDSDESTESNGSTESDGSTESTDSNSSTESNDSNGSTDSTDSTDSGDSNETIGWHGSPRINSPEDSGMELREPPSCGESLVPLSGKFEEVEYGRLEYDTGETFELEASPDPVALGEEITATLRWLEGDDNSRFGTGEKFTVERETDDGWESIYRVNSALETWMDMGSIKPESSPPTAWFEWSLTLTREGMAKPTLGETPYAVCELLEPGTYRFVYWSVSSPEGREDTDLGIGSEFTVTE